MRIWRSLLTVVVVVGIGSCGEHNAPAPDSARGGATDAQADTQADGAMLDMTPLDTSQRDSSNPCMHPPVHKSCNGGWCTIPAGCFYMSAPMSGPCRLPGEVQHEVTLTHGFEISDHEVTQGEFLAVMGYNPAYFSSCGTSCPVDQVSWHESAAYCNALSSQKGLKACYRCNGSGASVTCYGPPGYGGNKIYACPGYRLPTEAEWEYAYRAGTTTSFYSGVADGNKCWMCASKDTNADKIGWYCANAAGTTHPVKQKIPNAWGLYDMAGNVNEWCHDWYDDWREHSPGSTAVTNPVGQQAGYSYRVLRGGSWSSCTISMRAAHHDGDTSTKQNYGFGFRCSRTK